MKQQLPILVVEPDPLLAELLTEVLSAEGYLPAVIPTCKAASELAAEVVPALLVVHASPPGWEGIELACRLHETHPEMRSLYISSENLDRFGITSERIVGGAPAISELLSRIHLLLRDLKSED